MCILLVDDDEPGRTAGLDNIMCFVPFVDKATHESEDANKRNYRRIAVMVMSCSIIIVLCLTLFGK